MIKLFPFNGTFTQQVLAKSFIKHKYFFINSTIDLFASLTQKGMVAFIFKQELLKIWIFFFRVVRVDRKRSTDSKARRSKVNICVREERLGSRSELHAICLHSCVISKVM